MHFDDKVWTDFVRDTGHPETRSAVEQHLSGGCEECAKVLAQWNLMATSAGKERSYSPPQDVVRMVKQEFAIQRPKKEQEMTLLASLVFDSFSQAATSGMRSAAVSCPRQLVYKAHEITIDLRFEFQPLQSKAFVVGQVLEKNAATAMPIPLLLFNDNGAAVLETETSEFGEFQFEFNPKDRLRLSFELTAGRRVQVPLSDVDM